jgi:hypothetical protein
LKRTTSGAGGRLAGVQQVVEAPMRITRLHGEALPYAYNLKVERLDSHPLGRELGLEDQRARLAHRVEMDFVVEAGSVLWDAAGAGWEGARGDGIPLLDDLLALPARLLRWAGRVVAP